MKSEKNKWLGLDWTGDWIPFKNLRADIRFEEGEKRGSGTG
jgi:hypothetical protein